MSRVSAAFLALFVFLTLGAVVSDHILVTRLAQGQAIVMQDCRDASATPCFETIQAAIDFVEADNPSGFRSVHIGRRPDLGVYTEDLECDLLTGFTRLWADPIEDTVVQGATVNIQGVADSSGNPTITMGNCAVENLLIQDGTDQGDTILDLVDGVQVTRVVNSRLKGSVRAGDQEITISPASGLVLFEMMDSKVECSCQNASPPLCTAADSCIHIDSTSLFKVELIQNDISLTMFNNVPGMALFDIDAANVQILLSRNAIGCTDPNSVGHNCFEIDDGNVADLNMYFTFAVAGGVGATTPQGRFMDVIGAGTGSVVRVGTVEAADGFSVASRWGALMPNYRMGCRSIHSAEFDPDETQITYVEVTDSNDASGHAPNVTEANVDNFIVPRPQANFGLYAETATAPGVGQSWTIDLRDDGADTLARCVIDGTNTSCNAAAAGASEEGQPIQAQSRLNLMIDPSAAPAASAEMIVTFCLSEFPR